MKKNVEHDKFGNVFVKKKGKKKLYTPPNKKIEMGPNAYFVGRHTTG
jgi:hypothetical protein